MNELPSGAALDHKLPQWDYNSPKWWRVSNTAVPFALFSEALALVIIIGPHAKLPGMRSWGIALFLGIPAPLIWLRNGNRHLRNLAAHKQIDPAVFKLIAYFSVGIFACFYLLIAFIMTNLFLALKSAG